MTRLTDNQRMILECADLDEWVAARMVAHRNYSLGAAQAAMRRLSKRGLLKQDEGNPAIFRLTDEGREAIR